MSARVNRAWILSGLAVIAAMSSGNGVANAGSVGVKVTSNPLPGGSPFLYTIDLELKVGTITPGVSTLQIGVVTGSTVTDGLIGVTPDSGTHEPPYFGGTDVWTVPQGGIVSSGSGANSTEGSVKWDFLFGTSYSNNNPNAPIFIGEFTVETAFSYPDNKPPGGPFYEVFYDVTLGDGTTASGFTTVTVVPEPSSVILLLAGAGALPFLRKLVNRSAAKARAM